MAYAKAMRIATRTLHDFDFVEGSWRHIFGIAFPAWSMNVYGPGRHCLASLNGCVRPATTLSGNPCVYASMSENPRTSTLMGLPTPASFSR